jgi:hypothetical protein
LESWEVFPSSSIFSSSSRRFRRLRITEKFVRVPPIHRSVTTGVPVRWPVSWMTPFTCRFVPTHRMVEPSAERW